MRVLAAVVLLCLSPLAWAQAPVSLTWTPPSEYTNGDPLDAETDLTEYRLYMDGELLTTTPSDVTSYLTDELAPGTYTFTATAVAVNGVESAPSMEAVKEIEDTRQPNPPTWLDVVVAFFKRIWAWFA